MAKRKFEVGDQVRIITTAYCGAYHLREGKVVAYEDRMYRVKLSWQIEHCWWFSARELELVERGEGSE